MPLMPGVIVCRYDFEWSPEKKCMARVTKSNVASKYDNIKYFNK